MKKIYGLLVSGISYQMLHDYVHMNPDTIFEDVYYAQGLRPGGFCIMTTSEPKSGRLKLSDFTHFFNWVFKTQGKGDYSFQIIA